MKKLSVMLTVGSGLEDLEVLKQFGVAGLQRVQGPRKIEVARNPMKREIEGNVVFEEWDANHPRFSDFLQFLRSVAADQVQFVVGDYYAGTSPISA